MRVDFGNAEEHIGILAGGQVHAEKPVHNIRVSFSKLLVKLVIDRDFVIEF